LQNFHDVEVLSFKENTLALQVTANQFFLLFYGFALAVHFLKKDLHEVDLAQRQLAHFFDDFGLFASLKGWFEAL
jgi:hypothetical protein